jgi:restriction system protein
VKNNIKGQSAMKMSFSDAAYQILKEVGKPLHYKEITRIAIDKGLVNTRGLTPEASLVSVISQEIARYTKRGQIARFDQMGDGNYGLVEWQATGIIREVQEVNDETRNELRNRISNMPDKSFEKLVESLLLALGFDAESVRVTGGPRDHEIDVIGMMDMQGIAKIDVAVQVKRYKEKIGPEKIRELRGSLNAHQRGIFITSSSFTQEAIKEAERETGHRIHLINGNQLIDLLFEREIGVRKHHIYELDEDFWPQPPTKNATLPDESSSPKQTITVNYPLRIFARVRRNIFEGLLDVDGQVAIDDETFSSVSAAAIAVTGWKSCNGWRFWYFVNPSDGKEHLINVLRASTQG